MKAKFLLYGIWVCGSMINLLWLYTLQKYAVLLSITCTTLDASGNNISMDAAATLIHSFVSSPIDYCNSLLYGVPKCHIDKLQRVQNTGRQTCRYAREILPYYPSDSSAALASCLISY